MTLLILTSLFSEAQGGSTQPEAIQLDRTADLNQQQVLYCAIPLGRKKIA